MALEVERAEEETFGAVARGGSSADRHLDAAGVPALRGKKDPPAAPRVPWELARECVAGAALPSQASMPPRCNGDDAGGPGGSGLPA